MNKLHPFIVVYGAPNLGKTVQSTLLAKNLHAHYIKYPVYELLPTGPLINAALRNNHPVKPLELQALTAQNRRDYEPTLRSKLREKPVVGEAYTQTGIIAGLQEGISEKTLLKLNDGLLKEDFAILLDGGRFHEGIEAGHRFESADWDETRHLHLKFAKKLHWPIVNANQTVESVARDILALVSPLIF